MSTRIIHEKQDLKYLQWSQSRSSSGTAGSFLKATDDLQKPKKYYKLSNYDGINGIIGHECFVGSYYAQQNLQLIPREKMPQLHPLQEKHKAILLEGLDGIIPRYLQEKIWNMIWKRWLYYEDFCNQK